MLGLVLDLKTDLVPDELQLTLAGILTQSGLGLLLFLNLLERLNRAHRTVSFNVAHFIRLLELTLRFLLL